MKEMIKGLGLGIYLNWLLTQRFILIRRRFSRHFYVLRIYKKAFFKEHIHLPYFGRWDYTQTRSNDVQHLPSVMLFTN